jgi:hypothetical protein
MTYITYFFPQWFLARIITFTMTNIPMAGPVASLRVQRTVPGTADHFTYAKSGDVDSLKSLFVNSLASPHDVHFESGITALHLAISHQQVNVCQFLLQANADPFLVDGSNWSAADNAWDKVPSKTFPSAAETALREMFSETGCLERREFTVLHKILLGIVDKDLKKELDASTADVNARDSNNRTPLSMAIRAKRHRCRQDSAGSRRRPEYCFKLFGLSSSLRGLCSRSIFHLYAH